MPGIPVPDLGIWKEWIGSIRAESLKKANLVLFVEQPSDNPETLDDEHKRLSDDISCLFYVVHLRSGIECDSADLFCGSFGLISVDTSVAATKRVQNIWRDESS